MLEDILRMWDEHFSINQISIAMGISFGTIRTKLVKLRSLEEVRRCRVYTEPEYDVKFTRYGTKDKSETKMRKCLGSCGRMFMSTWIGNRMCKRCIGLCYGAEVRETR